MPLVGARVDETRRREMIDQLLCEEGLVVGGICGSALRGCSSGCGRLGQAVGWFRSAAVPVGCTACGTAVKRFTGNFAGQGG